VKTYVIGADCITRHYYRVTAESPEEATKAFQGFLDGSVPHDMGGRKPLTPITPQRENIVFHDCGETYYEPSSLGDPEEDEWEKS
jgi:hypothetical protein